MFFRKKKECEALHGPLASEQRALPHRSPPFHLFRFRFYATEVIFGEPNLSKLSGLQQMGGGTGLAARMNSARCRSQDSLPRS